jgi:hypothetical protein
MAIRLSAWKMESVGVTTASGRFLPASICLSVITLGLLDGLIGLVSAVYP